AGGGVLLADAAQELAQFVERLGIPVAHSLMGKGVLPDDHPFLLGMTGFWGTQYINDSTRDADVLLALGTRFCEADSSSFDPEFTFSIPPTKLIHIDIDPQELGRNFPVEIGALADVKQALIALNRIAKKLMPDGQRKEALRKEIAAYHKEFKASHAAADVSNQYPMRPERILADVRAVLPRDAIITTDVGWNKNGVAQQFPIYTPGTVLTPGGYATMGFGPPAAVGAKLAAPQRTVVSLVGDGGFGQNPAVLATARELDLAIVWLVMNNNAYGTIAGLQKSAFGSNFGTTFPTDDAGWEAQRPNYAEVARAYGCAGERVRSAADLKPALGRALASPGPYVIDVPMKNNPTPTTGHWNILDIYKAGATVGHLATD